MIKITVNQLKKLKACQSGIDWFIKSKKKTLKTIVSTCLKNNKVEYARWLLKNLLTKEQNQLWAIYSAELVLSIFEKHYSTDDRPRKAIQAAKDFRADKITITDAVYAATAAANAAANAAVYAANAAAYAAAYAATAADTAYAVTAVADAANATYVAYADNAAVNAANAAADAANTAAIRLKTNKKIMNYALKLLGEI